jgi:hypothetical protein
MTMGSMLRTCAGSALLLVTMAASAANVYKCKTAEGGVVVSNTPCARGAEPDAKLSSGSTNQPVTYETHCERIAVTGAGLVQIAAQLTAQQRRAVEREAFGRLNSAGASRILAEVGGNGDLRVCAYFPGGDMSETLIETSGLVRRDGIVDADDPVARATPARRRPIEICQREIDACRNGGSALDIGREECLSRIGQCSGDDCCPKACFDVYWQPPYDHSTGLAAMQASRVCTAVR